MLTPSQAHGQVRHAVRRGALRRPDACSNCGDIPSPGSDGRSLLQAHHHAGYDKPLAVTWLCAKCHRLVTPIPSKPGGRSYGEHNGQAKLTAASAEAIRQSPLSSRKIAVIYGVDKTTILRVRRGTHWSNGNV